MIQEILQKIRSGQIGIFPTDTLYAVSGSALNENAVERIFEIKKRSSKKPLIILIGSLEDLRLFGIRPAEKELRILRKIWPGKFSVILGTGQEKLAYLHRGTYSLAFRLPDDPWLRSFLGKSGPLVAPSANPEGLPPAKTLAEAKDYFKESVDFYFDKGILDSEPSALISIIDGRVTVLRPGGEKEMSLAKSLEQA